MYRLRGDMLIHVTEDHLLIQDQLRRGMLTAADARNSDARNVVTRALGVGPDIIPDVVEDKTLPGGICT